MKRVIESDRCLLVERQRNAQALSDLGLDLDSLYKVLLQLTPTDYVAGPESDYDGSEGQVWTFLHPDRGQTVYVKATLFAIEGKNWMKILSFHPDSEEPWRQSVPTATNFFLSPISCSSRAMASFTRWPS